MKREHDDDGADLPTPARKTPRCEDDAPTVDGDGGTHLPEARDGSTSSPDVPASEATHTNQNNDGKSPTADVDGSVVMPAASVPTPSGSDGDVVRPAASDRSPDDPPKTSVVRAPSGVRTRAPPNRWSPDKTTDGAQWASSGRGKYKKPDPVAQWKSIAADPDPFVRNVLGELRRAECSEPYHQPEKWRRQPWDVNPYEPIGPGFVVAKDLPEPDASVVLAKLHTDLPEGWTDIPPELAAGAAIDETPCMVGTALRRGTTLKMRCVALRCVAMRARAAPRVLTSRARRWRMRKRRVARERRRERRRDASRRA